ncbi:MAG: hypothetical protein MJZ18_07960 [Bacteroidales bacterium]|nr:hypothetical protein [Bacteroidales bacterium]
MGEIIELFSGPGGIVLAILLIVTLYLLVEATKSHHRVLLYTGEKYPAATVVCEFILLFVSQLIPAIGVGISVCCFLCIGYESKWFEEIDKKRIQSIVLMALAIFALTWTAVIFFGWVVLGLTGGTMELIG